MDGKSYGLVKLGIEYTDVLCFVCLKHFITIIFRKSQARAQRLNSHCTRTCLAVLTENFGLPWWLRR